MNQPQVYIRPLPPETPSHFPPHPTPLGCHRVPGLSSLRNMASSHWLSVFYVVMRVLQFGVEALDSGLLAIQVDRTVAGLDSCSETHFSSLGVFILKQVSCFCKYLLIT